MAAGLRLSVFSHSHLMLAEPMRQIRGHASIVVSAFLDDVDDP